MNTKFDIHKFKELFKALHPSLCQFAIGYLKDVDTSKDVVQEVFIKVWEKERCFSNENQAKAYLYTAVKNAALDVLKSKYVRVMDMQQDFNQLEWLESDRFFYKEVLFAETTSIIEKAMNSLPYRCSQIIDLSLKKYSNQEIADALSLSINTVKAQKKIAYKKMRPLLEEHYSFFLILLVGMN